MVQIHLKMDQDYLLFAEFLFAKFWGTPFPPLRRIFLAENTLRIWGGESLYGKIRQIVFETLPKLRVNSGRNRKSHTDPLLVFCLTMTALVRYLHRPFGHFERWLDKKRKLFDQVWSMRHCYGGVYGPLTASNVEGEDTHQQAK